MYERVSTKLTALFLFAIFIIILGYGYLILRLLPRYIPGLPTIPWFSRVEGIEKFASEEEFKSYLQESQLGYWGGVGIAMDGGLGMRQIAIEAPLVEFEGKGGAPERVSETTVQVAGIDEPDIIKTDGKEIYFSSGRSYYWRGFWEMIPPSMVGETKIIKAFPPAELKIDSDIKEQGDLLLHENILVIFSGNEILGYDVSNPKSLNKEWEIELKERNFVAGARLYKDKIYLINKTNIDQYNPCPIEPLTLQGIPLKISCTEIYHPTVKIPVDVTFTAMIVNPASGEIEKSISFVGSSGSSIVYMSETGLYITYSYYESIMNFFSNFLREKCKDLVPSWVIDKIDRLQNYDISDAAKLTEFEIIWSNFEASLNSDERLRIENEIENRMTDYYQDHKRELETTGIIKINLDEFEIAASGNLPGRPLNQFSLDEYNGNLRIATTVGEGFWWGFGGTGESANDVYVLDGNLDIKGSLKNLGLEERIYSARFIEDKGYLVTFRQIDPFFVIDLSDPKKPELKGELKIPGYSSYLHPITKDKILGIGKEGSKVKISLFDVSDPEDPREVDKYTLDEYWSDILNTHHAFLLDSKHQIFFLPGQKGGYIFSYKNNELELRKAVSEIQARRAIYLDDFLYIIGDNKIVVLNEINWEKVNTLEF